MAEFRVNTNFQFGGSLRRAGAILIVKDQDALKEKKKGINEDTKRPMSGLMNHCSPNDNYTEDLLAGKIKPGKNVAEEETEFLKNEKEKEIARLREEFKKLGKAYDPKWAVDKLTKELKKAVKEAGVKKAETEKKKETVKSETEKKKEV